jgi:AcrR family transcriptional regulator
MTQTDDSKRRQIQEDASAERRLLEAAEELFADKGFDAVSLREITARAGTNIAAVNYYFRSREKLIQAVIKRHVKPVNDERLERLKKLERRGEATVEEIVDAFMRPFVTRVKSSELSERMFLKLMGRMFGESRELFPEAVMEQFGGLMERFRRAFSKALPGVPDETLYWRIHFMTGATIHTMAHWDLLHRITQGRCGSPEPEQVLSRCIRFVAAGMREGASENPSAEQAPQKELDLFGE